MFQKILVPLDMTFKHRRAIDTAAELARQSGGEVVLLHVIELLHGMTRGRDKPLPRSVGRGDGLHRAGRGYFSFIGRSTVSVVWMPSSRKRRSARIVFSCSSNCLIWAFSASA